MLTFFDPVRQFGFGSVVSRLLLALLCGGAIGYGRARRNCEAGLRTYMLISLGAALSVVIAQYEYEMLRTAWAETVTAQGLRFDASRLPAQAITGIGFLGAGMILKISHQQVKGLTTAAGLFATVCMSLAAGAGFVECVITVLLLISLVLNAMAPLEELLKRKERNIALLVEMDGAESAPTVCRAMEENRARVQEVEMEGPDSGMFLLQLGRNNDSLAGMLCAVAALGCVRSVREIITQKGEG